jgi:DNA (cytosine-5)-methyltransferase 1
VFLRLSGRCLRCILDTNSSTYAAIALSEEIAAGLLECLFPPCRVTEREPKSRLGYSLSRYLLECSLNGISVRVNKVNMNYIELFAGCGGLSLGLRAAGGKLLLANELSPMAAETFAYNLIGEDLYKIAYIDKNRSQQLKTKWLSSQYSADDLKLRLRENPQDFPELGKNGDEINNDGSNLSGSLIVGSVVQLNKWLNLPVNKKALYALKNSFGAGNVDLVSGGPPCQSFSVAGARQYSNSRNVLPWEFAKFVGLVQPKIALLENVTGILRPFKVSGKSVFAWFEVAKAFASIGNDISSLGNNPSFGYVPLCLHVNAKDAGVAQHRTRFVMLAFREDVFQRLMAILSEADKNILKASAEFYSKMRSSLEVTLEDLPVHDGTKNPNIFKGTFLSPLNSEKNKFSASDAIDDLRLKGGEKSEYAQSLDRIFNNFVFKRSTIPFNEDGPENHLVRAHSFEVQSRFRVYQILSRVSQDTYLSVIKLLRGRIDTLDENSWLELSKFAFYMTPSASFYNFSSKPILEKFLVGIRTGKQSQRALVSNEPAPAALSIPDDMCHYHEEISTLRTLTVREMARIQSFPDNFVFKSKITTGGFRRKYEVPQYTQVGNAVPPILGYVLGNIISDVLEKYMSFEKTLRNAA